ncbi:TetR/AcrR family transcriptional regulator [Paenibacillus mesotrionivorans]|uniref:TetR/AcrR family transcriptional regulator n=1 Tax=Paenibacillus mesotrionivorans TaxID=3160968 RepID=A0ACC7P1P8_9BACL
MSPTDQDSRQSILDTAKILLDEAADLDKITIRQIAERAGVGIGLINYHFKSRDNLLRIAIGDIMSQTIFAMNDPAAFSGLEPSARLKELLKELYTFGSRNEKLIRFVLAHELATGNMQAPLLLIPLLRDIFQHQKNDMQLRIIALQILYPIQITALHPNAFHLYSGIQLTIPEERNRFIDLLIDNLVNQ